MTDYNFLSCEIFRPEGEVKAALFVVHGMQEHKERYESFAKYMNGRGYGVVLYDLPGHGQSLLDDTDGWFGEENGWDTLVGSAVEMEMRTRKEFPGVPVIYFGHSMGTMVGRTFLQKYDRMIDGIILSGLPASNGAAGAGKTLAKTVIKAKGKKYRSGLLTAMAVGGFAKSVKDARTPLDWLSYNEDNVDAYMQDPLCGRPFTAQGYYDLFDGMVRMSDLTAFLVTSPDLPVLLFAGEDDPCIGGEKGWKDTVDRFGKLGYTDVTSHLFTGMRHETMNEKNGQDVMAYAADWLDAHF